MSGSGTLVIDRERFLALALGIAAQGCGSAKDPVVVAPVIMLPVAAVSSAPPAAHSSPPLAVGGESASMPEAAEGLTQCEIENDTGSVDCTRFKSMLLAGPACEGVPAMCDLLAHEAAYRRRSAQAAAECLARLGKRACDINLRRQCFREGVKAACPEARFEPQCEAKMAECRAANVRIQYTKEECMKAMSSQHDTDRRWAISQMGPSSEGKCQLMYTIY
jgi:hypothetical protein